MGRIERRSSLTLWPLSSQRHFLAKRRPRRPIGAYRRDTTPMSSNRAVISNSSSLTSILINHNSGILNPTQIPGVQCECLKPNVNTLNPYPTPECRPSRLPRSHSEDKDAVEQVVTAAKGGVFFDGESIAYATDTAIITTMKESLRVCVLAGHR